jgi:hypothetical protein|tara:strand:- start:946 stop:1092 length:147 start_codon:yes stop_codon:yes gene_type:complete
MGLATVIIKEGGRLPRPLFIGSPINEFGGVEYSLRDYEKIIEISYYSE